MNQCKTCAHWQRNLIPCQLQDKPDIYGDCSSPAFVFSDDRGDDYNRTVLGKTVKVYGSKRAVVVADDLLILWDGSGYMAEHKTGQHFGCIHHATKAPVSLR